MSKRKTSAATSSVSPPARRRQRTQRTQSPLQRSDDRSEGEHIIRVYSWNVNGIRALLQKELSFQHNTLYPLRAFLKRHQWPQLLCLQEVKISREDSRTQRMLLDAANVGGHPTEPLYEAQFSLPRDKYNATGFGGKVYGVATLIRSDFANRLKLTYRPDWDLEGRVLVHEITTELQTHVVVNGYWVNGTSNPYRNSVTGVVEGTRHDHKLRFHTCMLDLAKGYENKGCHVILVGDMNVARSHLDGHPNLRTFPAEHVENRSDFNQKFFNHENGLRGVDVFRQIHGGTKKYTYHPRGCGWGQSCDRVDNIIVTRALSDCGAVIATDICDNPCDRGHSDHVPLWIEFDPSKIPIGNLSLKDAMTVKTS